jgi:hypothetical protein
LRNLNSANASHSQALLLTYPQDHVFAQLRVRRSLVNTCVALKMRDAELIAFQWEVKNLPLFRLNQLAGSDYQMPPAVVQIGSPISARYTGRQGTS